MSVTAVCDKSIESMIRNEYEAQYLQETLDMIFETIEGLATVLNNGDLYIPSYQNYEEICNILKYRPPDEYKNMMEHIRSTKPSEEEEDNE